MSQKVSKKCKSCGVPSRATEYPGCNKYVKDNCMICSSILSRVEVIEKALNQQTYSGNSRKVTLSVKIEK